MSEETEVAFSSHVTRDLLLVLLGDNRYKLKFRFWHGALHPLVIDIVVDAGLVMVTETLLCAHVYAERVFV